MCVPSSVFCVMFVCECILLPRGDTPIYFNNNNNNNVTILWNQQVQTDRTIPNNKLDIVIRDNEKGICMLIDVANPEDRNVI
jgi:hypothetical protein